MRQATRVGRALAAVVFILTTSVGCGVNWKDVQTAGIDHGYGVCRKALRSCYLAEPQLRGQRCCCVSSEGGQKGVSALRAAADALAADALNDIDPDDCGTAQRF